MLFGRVVSLILSFDTIKDTKFDLTAQIFHTIAYNVWPVKPCAVITLAKQETLFTIGFTGMLSTDQIILSLEGLLPLKEAGVF